MTFFLNQKDQIAHTRFDPKNEKTKKEHIPGDTFQKSKRSFFHQAQVAGARGKTAALKKQYRQLHRTGNKTLLN